MQLSFFLIFSAVLVFNTEGASFTGTIFCDNWFKLFVNGVLVKVDPVNFTPHQAVSFTFEDDQPCRTYAIYAADFADPITGLEYDDTCVGDGGIKITISDGTVSNSQWKVKVINKGPTNWATCYSTDKFQKCVDEPARDCRSETVDYDAAWCLPQTPDSDWTSVTEHTDDAVGWGRPVTTVDAINCIDPKTVAWGDAKFIWTDDIDYDNRILLRYTNCNAGATNTVSVSGTCSMVQQNSTETCGQTDTGTDTGTDTAGLKQVDIMTVLLCAVITFFQI